MKKKMNDEKKILSFANTMNKSAFDDLPFSFYDFVYTLQGIIDREGVATFVDSGCLETEVRIPIDTVLKIMPMVHTFDKSIPLSYEESVDFIWEMCYILENSMLIYPDTDELPEIAVDRPYVHITVDEDEDEDDAAIEVEFNLDYLIAQTRRMMGARKLEIEWNNQQA